MRILFLPTEKVAFLKKDDPHIDYGYKKIAGEEFLYFRHFPKADRNLVDIVNPSAVDLWLKKIGLPIYFCQGIIAFKSLKDYDFIIVHGLKTGLVVSFLKRLFRGKGAKIIWFDYKSLAHGSESKFINSVIGYGLGAVSALVYPSLFQKEYYQKHFAGHLGKIHYLPIGINPDLFLNSAPVDEGGIDYCLAFGYGADRDWQTLFRAWSEARTMVGRLELHLVGKNDFKSLPLGVKSCGRLSSPELTNKIRHSKFIILPIVDRPFAVGQTSLLQAFILRKAVIVSDARNINDYLKSQDVCLRYKKNNSQDLASLIVKLNEDEKLRLALGEQALKSVQADFLEEKMALSIEALLKSLL